MNILFYIFSLLYFISNGHSQYYCSHYYPGSGCPLLLSELQHASKGDFVLDQRTSKGDFVLDQHASKGDFVLDQHASKGDFVLDQHASKGDFVLDQHASKGEFVLDQHASKWDFHNASSLSNRGQPLPG
jgi:predicted transglutaminase-like cysteine proteinase